MWSGGTSTSSPWPKRVRSRAASWACSSSFRCHLTATEASTTIVSTVAVIGDAQLLSSLVNQVGTGERPDAALLALLQDRGDQRLAPGQFLGARRPDRNALLLFFNRFLRRPGRSDRALEIVLPNTYPPGTD